MGVSQAFKEKFPAREPGDVHLTRGTSMKSSVSPVPLDYLKRLVLLTNVVVADPGGMVVPYEGGYAVLALLEKAETTLAKDVLDRMVTLQSADGSWYQQYYPYKPFPKYEDRKVDSGASMMAFAMADYDKRNATEIYKTAWQKAASFLKSLENGTTGCVWNQVINGVVEQVAFSADMAEIILGLTRGLDAYGSTVTDSNGNAVKPFIERVISWIDNYMWRSASYDYQTEYPLGAQSEGSPGRYITFKQCVTFTQALVAWALKDWDDKYGTPGTHTQNISDALDKMVALNRGRWGGYLYHAMFEATDRPEEYSHYAALMKIAMAKVNPTRYARFIDEALRFMRWCALPDGAVLDCVSPDGRCFVSPRARGSLLITAATCILAGA